MKTVKGICKNLINTVIVCIMAAILFSVMTFCWLADTGNTFVMNFNSSTASAYFAGGNGSKEEPYKISTPVHMYNFAWLQYLGYFNLKDNFNNGRAQSFFELTGNIDMSSIAIPPIGTREYPFIGYFNGNGKTVYNVTVSNSEADFTRRPSTAQFQNNVLTMADNKNTNVDIVGLFGVTGDFNSFISSSYEKKDATTGKKKTVLVNGVPTEIVVKNKEESSGTGTGTTTSNKLEPLPSGNTAENVVYYSGMNVNSMYIDKITVKSVSTKTLVGLAAGYISSTVQNVGVYRSKVSVSSDTDGGVKDITTVKGTEKTYGTTISKYSLVGDYDEENVGWTEVPTDTWGGSIDMKTLNRRLNYMITEGNVSYNQGWFSSDLPDENNSEAYNTNIQFNSQEYYWKNAGGETPKTSNVAYLFDGTVLPLNVDKRAMYLDQESGAVTDANGNELTDNSGSKLYYEKNKKIKATFISSTQSTTKEYNWHTNSYYEQNKFEKVDQNNNTGYLVGYGTGSAKAPRARIQKVKGITNSINGSTETFDANNFVLLTVNTSGTTLRINDANNPSINDTVKAYGTIESSNFEHYSDVRNDFIDIMTYQDENGNTVGEQYVHGFHFLNSIGLTDPSVTEFKNAYILGKKYDNYQLFSGGLNFSAKKGSIRVIAGSYYQDSDNSLFDLFYVKRDSNGNILKDDNGKFQITKIEKIYKNSNGEVSYNTNDVNGTLAVDFSKINKNRNLKKFSAYYFEIPVIEGDYVIGCDKDTSDTSSSNSNTAYLMYLDIGANGNGGGELPYTMQSVDFVSVPTGFDDNNIIQTVKTTDSAGNKKATYPAYKDVGFAVDVGSGTDTVYYKRKSYDSLPSGDGEIGTAVYFWRLNKTINVSGFPSSYVGNGGNDDETNAKWN